jgi:predicted cupin superfamily sugar epimerase
MNADDIIRALGLRPHPEGGHYRETFRDNREIAGRAASTAIYFLLQAGEVSRWHTVDAVEIWHFYAGDPLEVSIKAAGQARQRVVLGPDIENAERPQAIVPAHAWQMARPLGAWTLAGCTVAPGFEFIGFVLAPPTFNPDQD